jgi:predicted negative regulator of RcsB-dependent stress response
VKHVAQHLTEEEQLETLKRWWAEYGRSIIIGIILAVGGFFGWQAWQNQQQEAKEQASVLYQELTDVVTAADNLSDEERSKAESIAEELKSDYDDFLYAADAALLMAGVAVRQGDLELAEQHLRWVLDQGFSEELNLLARLRLAKVLYGSEDYQQAMSLLAEVKDPGAYAAAYAELRGDLLMAQNQPAEAKTAYQMALDQLLPEQSGRRDIIQMKLDDIQAGNASVAKADEANSQ